jgi:hypothetical protein
MIFLTALDVKMSTLINSFAFTVVICGWFTCLDSQSLGQEITVYSQYDLEDMKPFHQICDLQIKEKFLLEDNSPFEKKYISKTVSQPIDLFLPQNTIDCGALLFEIKRILV